MRKNVGSKEERKIWKMRKFVFLRWRFGIAIRSSGPPAVSRADDWAQTIGLSIFQKPRNLGEGAEKRQTEFMRHFEKCFFSSLLSCVLKWSESKQWAVKWSSHPHLVRLAFLRTRDSKMRIDRRRKNYGWIHIAKIWLPGFYRVRRVR